MDFTFFPATTTTTTMTPAAAAVPSPRPASASASSACPKLPLFPRFVPAASPPSPAPAEQTSRATGCVIVAEDHQDPARRPSEKSAVPGAGGGDTAEVEDRMDQLWEDFNEELVGQLAPARRRPRGGGSCRRGDDGRLLVLLEGGRRGGTRSEPSASPSSDDTDSEHAARAAAGCVPVLRPSVRAAGGAGQCRRRAGTWVLLMRIFRRLFVIEKTISAAAVARQRSSSSVARAR